MRKKEGIQDPTCQLTRSWLRMWRVGWSTQKGGVGVGSATEIVECQLRAWLRVTAVKAHHCQTRWWWWWLTLNLLLRQVSVVPMVSVREVAVVSECG